MECPTKKKYYPSVWKCLMDLVKLYFYNRSHLVILRSFVNLVVHPLYCCTAFAVLHLLSSECNRYYNTRKNAEIWNFHCNRRMNKSNEWYVTIGGQSWYCISLLGPRYHPIAAMLAPCKCMLYTYLSPGHITGLTIQEKMWCTWRRGGIPAFPGSGKSMREFNSQLRGQILLWRWFILVLHFITNVHQTTPLVCPLFCTANIFWCCLPCCSLSNVGIASALI
mgnify:CR=1 FL=1